MINVVHVIDIAYVAHSLMKASQHNSALPKACTRCCTVHYHLFQGNERNITPITKFKTITCSCPTLSVFTNNTNVLGRFTVHVLGYIWKAKEYEDDYFLYYKQKSRRS